MSGNGGKSFYVMSVKEKAFEKTAVTNVTIGANVKTIGKEAFKNCKKLFKGKGQGKQVKIIF